MAAPAEPKHPAWRRVAAPLLVVAAVVAWIAWPQPLWVATAAVTRAPVRVVVSEPARARLRDRYVVRAPLDGVVSGLALRQGDAVVAGQAVATLVPFSGNASTARGEAEGSLLRAEHRLAAAEAEVSAAEAERARVRADAQRAEVLYAQRLLARDVVEVGHARTISADAGLRAALARRDATRAEVEAARAVVALQGLRGASRRLDLVAPATGVVLHHPSGDNTAVHAGQALLEIGSLAAVEVVADLRSTHALHLGPGTEVSLDARHGEAPLKARVRRVEPGSLSVVNAQGLREQRVTVVADLDPASAARARLAEGTPLQAHFVLDGGPDAVGVAASALRRDGPRWAVFVVANGRARLRHVEPGPIGKDLAAIYAGLSAGERVVLAPGPELADGTRVRSRP